MNNDRLPPGMEDLGPSSELRQDSPQILGAGGTPVQSQTIKAPPLQWLKDEEASEKHGIEMWYPLLETPFSQKRGPARDSKEFLPTERSMFLQLFTNDMSHYIFGVECYIIVTSETGVQIHPNPEFVNLPVWAFEEKEVEGLSSADNTINFDRS